MQAVLVMFRSDGERRSFSITRDVTVIGRREDCDFRIPLGEISRKHCRLIKDENALKVEDLGSSNGTYVNGNRVQESELNAGDTLHIGGVVFVLQIDGVPSDEQLQPMTEQAADAEDTSAAVLTEDVTEGAEAIDEATSHLEPAGASAGPADATDDFDPMAILNGAGESDIAPAITDSGAPADDVMVDLEESGHDQKA